MALSFSTTLRTAQMDAVTTAVGNAGLLRIYSGSRPATVGTALSGNTLLAELTCATPFAAGASSGVLTFGTITQDSSADATGTAVFFRLFKSDGTTAVADGSVGTSGSDLNLNTTAIVAGGPVTVTSAVWTAGNT